MFSNVGKKLQGLAKFVFFVGVFGGFFALIISIIGYENAYGYEEEILMIAIYVSIYSIIGGLLSAWPLFGLGILVEKAENDNSGQKTSNEHLIKKEHAQIKKRDAQDDFVSDDKLEKEALAAKHPDV